MNDKLAYSLLCGVMATFCAMVMQFNTHAALSVITFMWCIAGVLLFLEGTD